MDNPTELSERQIKILKAIIDEYISNGSAVGSEFLEKKFKLGYSPATIRNEMVVLGRLKYIMKAHFSSGRVPTPKAFRLYINSLLPKKQLSTAEEVSLKNEVWDYQGDPIRFFEESARALAKKSGLLSLVFLNTGFRYYTGVDNLLAMKEFLDYDLFKSIFEYIDDCHYWEKILSEVFNDQIAIQVLLGDNYLYEPLFNLGGVFSHFENSQFNGAIGLIGPSRLEYSTVLPLVDFSSQIIKQVLKSQDEKAK